MTHPHVITLDSLPLHKQLDAVLASFDELSVGESSEFAMPDEQLADLLDQELAGAHTWERLFTHSDTAPRYRLTKHAHTALPRIVGHTAPDTENSGSVWQLSPERRDLDANVIELGPAEEIQAHTGPSLDVVIVVLAGSGVLETEGTEVDLQPEAIVFLPRYSRRRFIAGDSGLRYFSVHQRKAGLTIASGPDGDALI